MTQNQIALINDSHHGVRGDSEIFLNLQIDFFKNFFIPECLKRGITKVVHCGDVFDKRKNINIRTLGRVRREIFEPLQQAGLELKILAGNHDVFFKNTNEYNSLRELLGGYDNIEIIDTGPEVRGEFGGLHKICYVPWITKANYDDCIGMLETTSARIVIGHFEIAGFDMHPGIPCHHGMDIKVFNRFEKVLSGHFHTRSTVGNITYLGTQYEMTWADCEDPKGFNILNSDLELEFVRYKNPMFIRINYDAGVVVIPAELKDKYVKLIVNNSPEDRKQLESVIKSIQMKEPHDFKIVENERNYKVDIDLDVEVEDTAMLMDKYVDTLDMEVNPARIKTILQELHTEALEA